MAAAVAAQKALPCIVATVRHDRGKDYAIVTVKGAFPRNSDSASLAPSAELVADAVFGSQSGGPFAEVAVLLAFWSGDFVPNMLAYRYRREQYPLRPERR